MKLLRISSNEETAQFNNNLNADLILEPYSQVALANASFTPANHSLDVNATNDTITYRCSTGGVLRTAVLTHREYNRDNADTLSLLQDIERKLNNQLFLNQPKEFGGEFKISQVGGRFACYYVLKPFNFFSGIGGVEIFTELGGINISGATGQPQRVMTNPNASVGNDSVRVQANDSIVKGAGCWRVQLNNLTTNNTANNGMRLVLTSSDVSTIGDTLTAEQNKYMIAIVPDGNNFKYQHRDGSGNTTDSNLVPNNPTQTAGFADAANDVIELVIEGGQVVGRVFQTAGGNTTTNTLFAVPYNDEDLAGLAIVRGTAANIGLYNPRFTTHFSTTGVNAENINAKYLSNYSLSTLLARAKGASIIDPNTRDNASIADPASPDTRQSTFTIDFTGAVETARYLGIIRPTGTTGIIVNRPNYTNVATFAGQTTFNFGQDQSFIIEFQSAVLNSYDGSSFMRNGATLTKIGEGGQFSILKVIPNVNINNNNSQINYEPASLAFIDINNKEPLLLRNISCRILNQSLEPIRQDDLGVLTLYLKPKSEII